MRTRFAMILLWLIFGWEARPQEVVTVEAEGIAALIGTPEEAAEQAKLNAMTEALVRACGVNISGLRTLTDGRLLGSFQSLEWLGTVKNIEKTKKDSVWNESRAPDRPLAICVKSWYRFEIVCSQNRQDPQFYLELKLNGANFIEGEDLIATLQTSKDCYLYLFIVEEDGKMLMIYPNSYHKENILRVGQVLQVPSSKDRECPLGLRFVLYTGQNSAGRPRAATTETLLAVGCKEPVSPVGLGEPYTIQSDITMRRVSFNDFGKWLTRIEPEKRTVAVAGYRVLSRGLLGK